MNTHADQPSKSFLDRQRDAALEMLGEQAAERRRISDLVLGRDEYRRRTGEIVKLGSDYLVEVIDGDRTTWTTVVNDKTTPWHCAGQEEALLFMIARRYDDNPNSFPQAAFYAGRVLGIPETQE